MTSLRALRQGQATPCASRLNGVPRLSEIENPRPPGGEGCKKNGEERRTAKIQTQPFFKLGRPSAHVASFQEMKLLLLLISFWLSIGCGACATIAPAGASDELERTWEAAIVAIPEKYFRLDGSPGMSPILAGRMKDMMPGLAKIPAGIKMPLVIYMHGCAGLDFYADKDKRFLVRHGYAFLAPDSFARQYKPKSCEPMTHTGGFHRGVLEFRLAEASHAHEMAKTLPWVDQRNIFMMGFSEGGITTARYGRGGLAGRIILGWTCHAPWPEYKGVLGPLDEPILAVVASKDPWFKDPSLSGDCGGPMASGRKIESITVDADVHYIQGFPEIQSKIIQFLEANRRPGN